jgi:hypothetical protein
MVERNESCDRDRATLAVYQLLDRFFFRVRPTLDSIRVEQLTTSVTLAWET